MKLEPKSKQPAASAPRWRWMSPPTTIARAWSTTAVERFGGVDILINNAGQSSSGRIESHDIETWAVDLDLKLYGAIRLAKLCIPLMRARGGGRIINLLNIGSKTPGAGSMPTAASRAAGLAMTKALSKEVAADQILVNAACIGSVESAQWRGFHQQRMPDATYEEFLESVGQGIPVKRIGTSEEAANMLVFLASDAASSFRAARSTSTAAPRRPGDALQRPMAPAS